MSGKIFNKFIKLCETTFSGRSSTQVLPVRVYPSANSAKAIKVYAVIDIQSNNTLASVMKYLTTEMRYQPQRQQIHITIFRTQLITWCQYILKTNTLLLIGRDFGDAITYLSNTQDLLTPHMPRNIILDVLLQVKYGLKERTDQMSQWQTKLQLCLMEEFPLLPLVQTISFSRRTYLNRYSHV